MSETTETNRRGRPSIPHEAKKKSTSFYLSEETRDDLRDLAREMRLSQASVIETLVGDARRKRGLKASSSATAGD